MWGRWAGTSAVMTAQTVPSPLDTPFFGDERVAGDWQSRLDHHQWGEELEEVDLQGPEGFHQLVSPWTHGRDTWCLGASVSLLKEPQSDIPCSTSWAMSWSPTSLPKSLQSSPMKDSDEEQAEVCFSHSAVPHRWALKVVGGEGNHSSLSGKMCDLIYN